MVSALCADMEIGFHLLAVDHFTAGGAAHPESAWYGSLFALPFGYIFPVTGFGFGFTYFFGHSALFFLVRGGFCLGCDIGAAGWFVVCFGRHAEFSVNIHREKSRIVIIYHSA